MNRKRLLIGIGLFLALAAGFQLAARMTNPAGGAIARDVVSSGGGRGTATNGSVLESTIGQPTTALMTAGNGSTLVGGYQTMVPMTPSAGVRRWDLY